MICYGIENDFPGVSSIYDSYMKDVSLDEIGDVEMYDTRKIHYPDTKPGDIPKLDDYVQFNVTHVSTPTSDTIIEDIEMTDEDDDEDEEEKEEEEKHEDASKKSSDFTDEEDESNCCFGFAYSGGYDGGYDSF
jgi:hypothetical protein